MTACVSGVKPTAATYRNDVPLSLDNDSLSECPELPQPTDGKPSTLMENHVAVTKLYHDCKTNHHTLIQGIKSQHGITVNGIAPSTLPDR